MGGENDDHNEEDHDHEFGDERTKFISVSESNLIIPKSKMAEEDNQNQNVEESTENGNIKNNRDRDQSQIKGQGQGRRKSTQSLVSNAQIHLQLFVEDVKEFAKTKIDDLEKCGGVAETEGKEVEEVDENGNPKVKPPPGKKVRTGWQRYLGIILAVTSSMIFALCILIVKSLPQYHPYSVSFWRFQGVLLPTIPIVFYYRLWKKQKIFDPVWPPWRKDHLKTAFILFLRGITGAGAVILQFYSLQFISMADSSVIAFSTPVFVSLASHVILGEKSGIIPVLCGVITLFGVAVITRPPMLTGGEEFDTNTLIGAGLAFGCMFLAAATFLILRYLRQLHFATITVYFGLWGSFQTLALSAVIGKFQPPEGLEHWMMGVALAGLTFIGQTCITLAFKFEQAGTVSLCRTCDILFAYVWQYVFLGVVPDLFSMIGGIIVVVGVLLAAFRKFVTDLSPDHPTRKKLWILLK